MGERATQALDEKDEDSVLWLSVPSRFKGTGCLVQSVCAFQVLFSCIKEVRDLLEYERWLSQKMCGKLF